MKLQALQSINPIAFQHFVADLSQYEFRTMADKIVCKLNDPNAGPLISEWTGSVWTDWRVDEEELRKFRGSLHSQQYCEWDQEIPGL